MKVPINKKLIQEGVLANIREAHLTGDVNPDGANDTNNTKEPTQSDTKEPKKFVPVQASELTQQGHRNLFMGQKASNNYTANHIKTQVNASLK